MTLHCSWSAGCTPAQELLSAAMPNWLTHWTLLCRIPPPHGLLQLLQFPTCTTHDTPSPFCRATHASPILHQSHLMHCTLPCRLRMICCNRCNLHLQSAASSSVPPAVQPVWRHIGCPSYSCNVRYSNPSHRAGTFTDLPCVPHTGSGVACLLRSRRCEPLACIRMHWLELFVYTGHCAHGNSPAACGVACRPVPRLMVRLGAGRPLAAS